MISGQGREVAGRMLDLAPDRAQTPALTDTEQTPPPGPQADETHVTATPPAQQDALLEATILELTAARGEDKTICPSDAARHLAGKHPDGWGPLMTPIRRVAVRLAHEGRVVIYRKGKPADPDNFKGVYRIGLPRQD